ncbi:putative disease resistance protein At1g50180 [Coffea arabica]|uniref:Disease resistance protein At1g50180 n=1 Tax=Coffea arabica TaxID=13443 RepID=A0ABM4UY79_COFAR
MTEAAVNFAVETIRNLIEETKFLHVVSDQVAQLQDEIKQMRSFFKDADARQHDEETVKEWISQARDLAYEVDDLFESYAFKIAGRMRKGIRGTQTLKTKISHLTKRLRDYGIRVMERQEGASSSHQQLRRTYSHVVDDDFVGLEGDVEMLVKHLVRGSGHEIDKCFSVVSICGMGGLGKTTLARKVYNHPQVRRCLDMCITNMAKGRHFATDLVTPNPRKERRNTEVEG